MAQKHRTKKKNYKKGGRVKTHHKTQKNVEIDHNSKEMFLNCSPVVKDKTPVQGSCFTVDVLYKLKKSYNKHHPHHKIDTTEPSQIWKELKKRMSVCTKEDCWLKIIQSPEERKKIDKYLFAPDQPDEWKSKPNTWLSNFDILAVIDQFQETYPHFKFIGPTPIDFDDRPNDMQGQCVWKELCSFDSKQYIKDGKKKIGIVFNLDKHNEPGSHWVSLFIDFEDHFIFYMDSAGEYIDGRINKLVKKIQKQCIEMSPPIKKKFHQNHPLEHQMGNTECGMYSLYFIITMLTGETEEGKLNTPLEKINFFKGKRIPDKYIEKFRNIYFNP